MQPRHLRAATLAVSALLTAPAAAYESRVPYISMDALEPAVASCVLANIDAALTPTAASLLVQSCTALVAAGGASPQNDDQLFVKCKVAGDPEWIEFRLVTRRQCAAAAGAVQR